MKTFLKKEEQKIIEIDQKEVFKDLYNLGKLLCELPEDRRDEITPFSIKNFNILDWNKQITRTDDKNNKKYTVCKYIDTFLHYVEDLYENSSCHIQHMLDNEITHLIDKYGTINYELSSNLQMNYVRIKTRFTPFCFNRQLTIIALYIFVVKSIIDGNKDDKDLLSRFVYFESDSETVLTIIYNSISNNIMLNPCILFKSEFLYIFTQWYEVGYLELCTLLSNYKTNYMSKEIATCRQCGSLFVQQGKETLCSEECKRENARLRQRKSRNKKASQMGN